MFGQPVADHLAFAWLDVFKIKKQKKRGKKTAIQKKITFIHHLDKITQRGKQIGSGKRNSADD